LDRVKANRVRRYLSILLLIGTFLQAYLAMASLPQRYLRLNLRWNGQFSSLSVPPLLPQRLNYPWTPRGRWLPVAGSTPTIPVYPWSPTNALGSVLLSTNRPVLPDTLRVLFLGNGLTSGHDMPTVLTRMSRIGKQKIKASVCAVGGYNLENHFTDVQSRTNISHTVRDITNPTNRLTWHVVILQEQSQIPVFAWQRMLSSAQKLDGAIKAAKTQTALFMPQSRSDPFFTQSEFLDRAEGGYNFVAQQINCPVVPVGRAWQILEARHPNIQLRERDGFHPSPHGAYLNACMFYAYLTWQSPLGLSNGGLFQVNEQEAMILQRIAWEVFASRRSGIPF
jgi:hypothetical protein